MNTKLIFRGDSYDLDRKAVQMPRWRQILDQQEELGEGSTGYTKSVWANRCITIRANALAAIDWVLERDRGGNPVDVENHSLLELLSEVNPEANWPDLIRATEADLLIHGKAFWEKIGNENKPQHLMRLNAASMKVNAGPQGVSGFEQDIKKGKPRTFDREQIVYFHYYDPENDFGGVSPTLVAKSAIDTEAACNAYLADFFNNFAMPAFVVEYPQEASPDREQGFAIIRSLKKLFGGKGNRHKTGIVPGGGRVKPLTMPIKDLALEDIRAEARRDICSAFGVPPAIAGAWEAANYATATEQRASLYTETVIAESEYMAGVINAELIKPYDSSLNFRWKVEDIDALQPDRNQESERVVNEYLGGLISQEAALELIGYDELMAGAGVPLRTGPGVGFSENGKHTNQLADDLGKWKRKARNVFEKHGNARDVGFSSNIIPPVLNGAIKGRLKSVGSAAEIDAIFAQAMNWVGYP